MKKDVIKDNNGTVEKLTERPKGSCTRKPYPLRVRTHLKAGDGDPVILRTH
jgi:hypothetical protein